MPSRKHVETLLRINGYDITSSDDEIRSVLVSARYTEKDVETVITMLRGKISSEINKNNDGLHKVFRTNEGLKPHEIAKLLNIEVPVKLSSVDTNKNTISPKKALQELAITSAIMIGVACVLLLGAMFYYKIGLFHPIAGAFN